MLHKITASATITRRHGRPAVKFDSRNNRSYYTCNRTAFCQIEL